jgi:two-component system sensor histidine kinase KdpD
MAAPDTMASPGAARVMGARQAPGHAVSTEPPRAPAAMHPAGGATSSQRRQADGGRQQGPAVRGRLRVYLGVAPGAGATCMLLREGHGRAARGADVVVASVATHGRPGTARLLAGLEIVPPAAVAIGDTPAGRLDLDAVLARKPQVALVDELAHRNPPGPGGATRWQEAAALLAAGIDVISTVSIGQLDSVADLVEKITRVPALLTVPDPVLLGADEIELVDVAPEALRDRMARGHIYPAGRAGAALASWCAVGPLHALRQLTLGWLAATLAQQRQRSGPAGHGEAAGPSRERVVVALSGGAEGQTLIRRAARIAARCGADLLAVHIIRPGGRPAALTAGLVAQRQLTESLGGTYHQLTSGDGDDVAAALLAFVRADHATQLVLGMGHPSWRSAVRPKGRIISRVIRGSTGTDVHIVTTRAPRTVRPSSAPAHSRKSGSVYAVAGRAAGRIQAQPPAVAPPSRTA